MRRERSEKLLARLHTNACVGSRKDHVSNGYLDRALDLLDELGEVVFFVVLWAVPRDEMPHFPVVSIIGKVQLGTDEQDLAIEDDDTTVVPVVAVHDGHANIGNDAVYRLILQDDGQLLPCMEVGVAFEEMV